MSTKEQLEEVAASFLACKAATVQAKEALWSARDAALSALAKAGESTFSCNEMWDMADFSAILQTLSIRLQERIQEYEAKAEEQSGP